MSVPVGAYGRKRPQPVVDLPGNKTKKRKLKKKRKEKSSSTADAVEEEKEFSSTADSLRVVSEFHTLNKRIEQVKSDKYLSEKERKIKLDQLEQEIEKLGGLEKYQRASIFGADTNENAGFSSSKWVLQELKCRGYSTRGSDAPTTRVLDVGAINNQYLDHSDWLHITPIDLNPQHPSVLKADFFEYAKEFIQSPDTKPFDILVLSLVINFVGNIRKRGEMIALCAHPELLCENGLLFIVLPSACIQNSRYMKYSRFVSLFQALGFSLVSHKLSKKLVFWIFRLTTPTTHYDKETDTFNFHTEFSRKLVRGGTNCNNFTILLKNDNK